MKRGLALTPVKFGISFTATPMNQAGALVHVYTDGSVHLNHGGTEMGQGLLIKVAQIVAEELQVDARPRAHHRHQHRQGAEHLADRGLQRHRPQRRGGARGVPRAQARCRIRASIRRDAEHRVPAQRVPGDRTIVRELASATSRACSLSATGFYRTPEIHFDRETCQGEPFFYFAYGAAVSEVVDRHADRRVPRCCAPTCCTTSAAR